ncbi:hypothetical protein DIPPA_56299 [Diplonema papillatum]|nr:hypothetical protein DIPPA_56299 [Diplonema papillatum]
MTAGIATGFISEVELLKEASAKEKLLDKWGVSLNRMRKCWHAFGRVVRQMLLEAMGEKWHGGGVVFSGLCSWWGLRRVPDGTASMRFLAGRRLIDKDALKVQEATSVPSVIPLKEVDISRVKAICDVAEDVALSILRSIFTKIGEISTLQDGAQVVLPHVGRFAAGHRKLEFGFSGELLEVLDPRGVPSNKTDGNAAARAMAVPGPKLIASIQGWLSNQSEAASLGVPVGSCRTSSKSIERHQKAFPGALPPEVSAAARESVGFSAASTVTAIRRPSSTVALGTPLRAVRHLSRGDAPELPPRYRHPTASSLDKKVPWLRSFPSHNQATAADPRNDKDTERPRGVQRLLIPAPSKGNHSVCDAVASSLKFDSTLESCNKGLVSVGIRGMAPRSLDTGIATRALSTRVDGLSLSDSKNLGRDSAEPIGDLHSHHFELRIPQDALRNVLADAYQRHQAHVSYRHHEEQEQDAYISQRIKEAQLYERNVHATRKQLVAKTKEALSAQVCETKKLNNRPAFLKENVIPLSDDAMPQIPQVCLSFNVSLR